MVKRSLTRGREPTSLIPTLPPASSRRSLTASRIGVLRALNRNIERVFDPTRKEHRWGRRRLARDR